MTRREAKYISLKKVVRHYLRESQKPEYQEQIQKSFESLFMCGVSVQNSQTGDILEWYDAMAMYLKYKSQLKEQIKNS